MTDLEEKAKEYAHNKMAWCEDYDFDENTAEQYIKQAYIDGFKAGIEHTDEQCSGCNHLDTLEEQNSFMNDEIVNQNQEILGLKQKLSELQETLQHREHCIDWITENYPEVISKYLERKE